MTLHIDSIKLYRTDLRTRLPFKYGIATMTEAPHVFLRLALRCDGKPAVGTSADHLPPKWFTKSPDTALEEEIDEMLGVIRHASEQSVGLTAETPFQLWHELYTSQADWAAQHRIPPLLAHFGTSLVERAVIEACCRSWDMTFAEAVHSNALGVQLGRLHGELEGGAPGDWIADTPRRQITARHTVGMADPLSRSDVPDTERLRDGLPQSLDECLEHYGLRQLKVKLSGEAAQDIARLEQIRDVCAERSGVTFSVDGNEQFTSVAAFQTYWECLQSAPELSGFWRGLLFVEQPFHRDVALDRQALAGFAEWSTRPPVIIDESDAELDSLRRALNLGYHGTSHKNCKGIFKSLANACLLQWRRTTQPAAPAVLSGEDLANTGPVALLQDLAAVATLGIESVERNGHHYFAGLSAFPADVQTRILDAHPDLYHRAAAGWPTLHISQGCLSLDTVNAAPFGVGFVLPVAEFPCVESYT